MSTHCIPAEAPHEYDVEAFCIHCGRPKEATTGRPEPVMITRPESEWNTLHAIADRLGDLLLAMRAQRHHPSERNQWLSFDCERLAQEAISGRPDRV